MTPLRLKMVEAMRERGFSARTQDSYTRAVVDLARYHGCSPQGLGADAVALYFRHLTLERGLSASSCRVYFHGVRFLYERVLGREDVCPEVVLPKSVQRIPELLTRAEVRCLLGACGNAKHRMALSMAYGCGLRVSEVVSLRVGDIDGERELVHVVQGKGAKDRMVVVSPGLLAALRGYWRTYRPSLWLFPGRSPDVGLAIASLQKAYTRAKAGAGVTKVGGVHALRHAYATHQLEAGLPVHVLQRLLGHGSVNTTMRYVHWVAGYRSQGVSHCDLVAALEPGR